MSVWDTFSASFHLVQEKLLEQVLEDTPTTTNTMEEEEVRLERWMVYLLCTHTVYTIQQYTCVHNARSTLLYVAYVYICV